MSLDKDVNSESDLSLELKTLESGIYFINIDSKGKKETIKFIIK